MEPRDPALFPLLGLALFKRMGKFRKKKRSAAQAAPVQPSPNSSPPSYSGIPAVISFLRTVAFVALLLVYLVIEVFTSMLAYAYLNLYQIDTFGYLIRLSRNLLTTMQNLFETYAPHLADRAYATLLGEIGPKSILLLFIGLAVSMIIRFILWAIHKAVDGLKSSRSVQTSKA
jgi:hypothetical protein